MRSKRFFPLVTLVPLLPMSALALVLACGPSPSEGPPATPAPLLVGTAQSVSSAEPAGAGPQASAAKPRPLGAAEVVPAIKEITPLRREVPEAGRDAVFDELKRALGAARGDGGKDPLRLFGVSPDNLLGKLGLENGDRFEALEDKPVATESAANDALTTAHTRKSVSLRVQRKGATVNLVYDFK